MKKEKNQQAPKQIEFASLLIKESNIDFTICEELNMGLINLWIYLIIFKE